MMNQKIFLENAYNHTDFINFVNEFLPSFIYDEASISLAENSLFESARILGTSIDGELATIEINLSPESQGKRIAITKEAFKILRDHAIANALIVFTDGTDNWRLSLLTTTIKLDEKGKVITESSNPRRYSFFLGLNAKTRTPYESLIKKGSVKNLNELQERFSVEVVNKQFYELIADLFTKLVGGERSKTKKYPGLLKINGIISQNVEHQEFAVRLIGRIIFSWFLKEKKSDAGVPIIPNELLSSDALAQNEDYYHSILEPLFFELLNKRVEHRHESLREEPFSTVPYLNGGLFSPQYSDFYNQKSFNGAGTPGLTHIPDAWFKELFEVLEQYNFTVDENTSYDVDLSIDPEMLGRIFENLLAEINPETGESARKSTGSFYTPREIVDYMVDSSLLEFLKNKTSIEEAKLKALITWEQDDDLLQPLEDTERERVVDALADLTILDPACGSGAFPIGILQKVVYVLQQADPDAKIWLRHQIGVDATPEFRQFIESQNYDYIRKLGVIRKSIFGVDIQPIATEISRLRCFLTLVIEENVTDDISTNRGIEPLPNLEFKFVAANSLIGLKDTEKNLLLQEDDNLKELEARLFELRTSRYFRTKSYQEKRSLQQEDKQLCDEIILATAGVEGVNQANLAKWQAELNEVKSKLNSMESIFSEHSQSRLFGEDEATQLKIITLEETSLRNQAKMLRSKIKNELNKSTSPDLAKNLQTIVGWNPYQSGIVANYFDSEWMFGITKFDIVIGNPPYIQLQKNGGELANLYKDEDYKTFARTGDIYSLFYERGLELTKAGSGLLCYITSNKWMRAGYGDKTRDYFASKNPISLIDFGGFKVFESATVDTNILLIQNTINQHQLTASHFKNDYQKGSSVKEYFDTHSTLLPNLTSDTWFIGDSAELALKTKIESVGTPLKNWDIKIYRGVLTGCNEAFIIDEQTKARLIAEDPNSADIIKPLLRGRDIKRYSYDFQNLYILATGYDTDIQSKYPAIYNYLKSVGDKIESGELKVKGKGVFTRDDQGKNWWNLRACDYYDEFEKEKIAWSDISTESSFTWASQKLYVNNTGYILTGANMAYLLAILNSKLTNWYYPKIASDLGTGLRYIYQFIIRIPVPKQSESNLAIVSEIEKIVEDITTAGHSTPEQDTQLDQLVYQLYNLTPEEIAIIKDTK
ncbi:MAG: Eco57I restriction-modification methylase domain-containing protein [Candidatus Nomurabacteria bacterium]|nr:Eco57I restriction-modification methylase domain-containing protein [Candidatus Saccharibacteria bacterium]USN95274.1 MAG: Eco57I restriction-modification methylase domain-containing protein [Candidatus Nomurabacteria bacterium]